MNDSTIKSFLQNTYQSKSPIPYIITIQVIVFLIISILGIFNTQSTSLFIFQKLSLATSFGEFIHQPWSILTFPFTYNKILPLLFDCLWMYWIGNMFLNLLTRQNFLFVFFGGLIIGALINLSGNSFFPFITHQVACSSITYGLTALIAAQTILTPKSEVNLMLLGNVKFQIIAFVFMLLNVTALILNKDYAGFLGFIGATTFGFMYIKSLQSGRDWSHTFERNNKRHLKVVYGQKNNTTNIEDRPSQETIDQILDKISVNGYESLSKTEKATLFKVSNKDE